MAPNRCVSRLQLKLKKSIDQGEYYEAHQIYRTLYFRLCSQEKYDEVLDLLFDGSTVLLTHNQQSSGADLSLLYLEVLEKSKLQPTEDIMKKIAELFSMLDKNIPERHQFLVKAVTWTSADTFKQGHPFLHQNLAQVLWKEKNYGSARYHYLRSEDGCGCGTMLVELHLTLGYTSEADLFLVQAVLQYLCLQKKVAASQVFETFTTSHPTMIKHKGPPYLLPLLNFLWLLLSAIDHGKVVEYTVLCEQYQPSLGRDPTYKEYLDKIGQLFFNMPPPCNQQRSGNYFSNLFQRLLGDSDDESSGEETTTGQQTIVEDVD